MPGPMGRLPAGYSPRPSPPPTADFVSIERRCFCPPDSQGVLGRRPPIRVFAAAAAAIQRSGLLHSTTPIASFRCNGCKRIIVYTAADLGFASPALRAMSS